MKKRKLLLLPLALLCTTSLTACNKGGDETSSSAATSTTTSSVSGSSSVVSSSSVHTHTYDNDKWTSDETKHWHADTCGHNTKKDEADHTFVWGKCTVCGYNKKVNDGFQYTYCDSDADYDVGDYYCIDGRTDTTNMTGEVVIPGKKDDSSYPVVKIDDAAYPSKGKGVFEDCTQITTLVISENIRVIGDNTFKGCTGIETIVFPTSIKKIATNAFSGCTNIKSIYYFAGTNDRLDIDGSETCENINEKNKWYFYSEEEPDSTIMSTNFWHYDDDGIPTVWPKKN